MDAGIQDVEAHHLARGPKRPCRPDWSRISIPKYRRSHTHLPSTYHTLTLGYYTLIAVCDYTRYEEYHKTFKYNMLRVVDLACRSWIKAVGHFTNLSLNRTSPHDSESELSDHHGIREVVGVWGKRPKYRPRNDKA